MVLAIPTADTVHTDAARYHVALNFIEDVRDLNWFSLFLARLFL